MIHVFVIIGFNYRRVIPYDAGNSVGKMNTQTYTTQILPKILDDFRSRGLTLIHDADSAHLSTITKAWVREHNLKVLPLPGVSPDMSIFESTANSLKRKFHQRATTSKKTALIRFNRIFLEDISQEMIENMYNKYPKRLEALRQAEGQMTRY
jgi:hypothetical protein